MILFLRVVLDIDPLAEDNVAAPASRVEPSCSRPRAYGSVKHLALFDLTNLARLPRGQVKAVEVLAVTFQDCSE